MACEFAMVNWCTGTWLHWNEIVWHGTVLLNDRTTNYELNNKALRIAGVLEVHCVGVLD